MRGTNSQSRTRKNERDAGQATGRAETLPFERHLTATSQNS